MTLESGGEVPRKLAYLDCIVLSCMVRFVIKKYKKKHWEQEKYE